MFNLHGLHAVNKNRVINRYKIQFCPLKNKSLSTKLENGNFTQNKLVINFDGELPMPNEIKILETPKDFLNYFFDDCLLSNLVKFGKCYHKNCMSIDNLEKLKKLKSSTFQ